MPHRTFIYTGSRISDGARALAQAMGVRRIRTENSRYRYKLGDVIINWGSTQCITQLPDAMEDVINSPHCVRNAVNKLNAFNIMRACNVSIPDYTTTRDLVNSDDTWFARRTLAGSGGSGITIINPGDPIPDAPLYVKYIPKRYEVRIHVGNGAVFDWQQKMRARDSEHSKIRSHDNGYTFVRNNTNIPLDALRLCKVQALEAVQALGLHFGAVDVIFNEHRNTAFVLEINSAPGLEGTTVTNYARMLRGLIDV